MARRRGQLNLDMSHVRLSYFLAVYEQKTINKAAAELGISQQALSKSIAKLESALKVDLFERTPVGVQPTIFGDRLAERARVILAEAEIAASELEALRGYRSGMVRLGVGPSLAAIRAPEAICELRRRLPDVGISTIIGNTETLLPMLTGGALDIIVSAPVASIQIDESLNCETFGDEYDEVVGRADHPLRQKEGLRLEDFADFTWVGETSTSHVIRRASKVFVNAQLSPFVDVISTSSMDLLRSMIIRSDALSLLCKELYHREFEAGLILPFDVPEFKMTRQIRMFSRSRSKPTPPVRLMTEILRDRLSQNRSGL